MVRQETPVLLLTGYLGSGKTTLLNRILANKQGIKFAVVVNDIGEVNIDAELIEKGGIVGQEDESLVALQNGCICCTLKMDLVKQLHDLIALHCFDYIVIEASGICEPAPIAQTICSFPSMEAEFTKDGIPYLDCIVTVVDALRMKDEFGNGNSLTKDNIGEEDIESLIIQQIEFCNIVLLNKASEVSPEELNHVKGIIRGLQPHAEIIPCDFGNIEFNKILNTNLFEFDKVASSARWMEEIDHHIEEDDDNDDDHHDHHELHHHHHHHEEGEAEEYGISTYVYYRRQALDIVGFDEFVARKWPKGIIRAKGICYFDDERDMCYIFEQAGKQVTIRKAGQWYATMPADELEELLSREPGLRKDWDDKYGDRMQKIVFIGQHIDKKAIADTLDKYLIP